MKRQPDHKNTVFLISQIGPHDSDIRKRADVVCDRLIKPIVGEFDLTIVRSDRDPTPGVVTSQILRSILEASVVIADLTGKNANVFYEVAFAQSFGKPIVMLVDDPDNLPFDTRNERTIRLGGHEGPIGFEDGVAAQDRLREALQIVLAPGYAPASLITEVAGVRSLADLAPENPIATELASVKDTVEEIRALVRRTGRSENTQADVRVFTKFIKELIEGNRLFATDLESLASTETASNGLKRWASQLAEALVPPPKDVDPDDIPF
jgi:hypothetical protein